jgi:ABC-type glycerol-3-phosphate transport system permease component
MSNEETNVIISAKRIKQKAWLRRLPTHIIVYLMCGVFALFAVYPILWAFSGSLKRVEDFYQTSLDLIPRVLTLANYARLISSTPFTTYLFNSVLVAVPTTGLCILASSLAAYGLSRFRFPGSRLLATSFLVTQMIPNVLLLLPLFIMLNQFKLINTYPGIIVTYLSFSLPFATWMLSGYFDTIPIELEEAAMIDGCGNIKALFLVILPVAAPGLAVTAIFSFLLSWKEFPMANVILRQTSMFTLPVGLARYSGAGEFEADVIGRVLPMAMLTLIVPIIFFLVIRRHLVSGLSAGFGK